MIVYMFVFLHACSKTRYLIFNKFVCVCLSNNTADALCYIKLIISK